MRIPFLSRIILLCCLCLAMSSARAQYVAIPDSNFGNWLHNNGYSSCLIGNSIGGYQLDTTCSAVLSADTINCYYSNIYDLTGVEYFRNLTILTCGDNHLTFLPALPPLLDSLDCSLNMITALGALPNLLTKLNCGTNRIVNMPTLPSGLVYLDCYSNLLITLPSLPSGLLYLDCGNNHLGSLSLLPAGLLYLYCDFNNLYSLPPLPVNLLGLACDGDSLTSLPTLPSTLTTLGCGENQLTSIPTLPSGLTYFVCNINMLTSLPNLPTGITQLWCGWNQLTSLPPLPDSLRYLYCNNNQLLSLPSLPSSLVELYCNRNQILTLPTLNFGLSELVCDENQLTNLPALPLTLYTLSCDSNQLTSLPPLPPYLTSLLCAYNPNLYCLPHMYYYIEFSIAGTNIQCIPNAFSAMSYDINPDSLPLCNPASGCDFYYNIGGNVNNDISPTCTLFNSNPGPGLTNMKVQLQSNGQVIQQFYTFNSGGYSFKTDSMVTYTVSVDTSGIPLIVACPASGLQYAYLTPLDTTDLGLNFGLQCSNYDFAVLGIYGSHFRPEHTSQININAGNFALKNYNANCGSGMSGTVTTTLTGSLQYVNPATGALTPSSVSGNVLTYNLSNLDSLGPNSLNIIVSTDTGAVAGSNVCITTIITPSVPDINPWNDTLTQCFVVVNSWDPNDKEVYPNSTSFDGGWLTYTINFQNTGTDTAYLVVVTDTLSPYIDASSFQLLGSSSKAVTQLFGNAVVFTFPHINLVDSVTNPPLSSGWIQYKVRSLKNLPAGTQLSNTAYVYFDNNPAVVTNTTVNSIVPSSCADTTITLSQSICTGDSFYFNTRHLITAGIYMDTVTRIYGCDSIITLNLIVKPLSYDTITHSICQGDTFTFGGRSLTASGAYTDTLTGSLGCDSIITLNLTVKPLSYDTISHSICQGDTFTFSGRSLTASGSYTDTITGSLGCDSLVILNLTVNPLPVVSLSWDTLAAEEYVYAFDSSTATFCHETRQIVPLAGGLPLGGYYYGSYVTNDTLFIPNYSIDFFADTFYYTFTDSNGCSATAVDSSVATFCDGVQDIPGASTLHLYPNPNRGTFTLETSGSIGSEYTINDMLGAVIAQEAIRSDSQEIDLPGAAEGVYTLVVKGALPVRFIVLR